MIMTRSLFLFLIFSLVISSCAIEVDQPPVATQAPTLVSVTSLAPSTESAPETNTVAKTQIPVTWADLGLTGRLVYINGIVVDNVFNLQVQVLDLLTGEITTVFDAPKYSWIYYVTVSPDNEQIIMSYSPPPGDNPVDQDIYTMPLDGSQPLQLLFTPPTKEDDYIEVEYSPDSKYVYVTHVNYHIPPTEGQIYPLFTIYRKALPDGELELIAEKAYWPRISPDSSQITYVTVDLFTRGNKLFVADADGENAREVEITGPRLPDIKDAPLFSADGQSIIFSAEVPVQSYKPTWLDKFLGVSIAKAHSNVPSDWWSIPVTGGVMTQLTNIQSMGLFGSLSPDQQFLASYSLNGIFVMKTDGTQLTQLLPNPQSLPGTVCWIP
jgi:Tol biopolymer transport system component